MLRRRRLAGWMVLMSVMLTGMGTMMVMLGVLGEYLWRALDETRGRPKYVIEETSVVQERSKRSTPVESVNPTDHPARTAEAARAR